MTQYPAPAHRPPIGVTFFQRLDSGRRGGSRTGIHNAGNQS